jgi:NAD(P)H-dependent FMN reductase
LSIIKMALIYGSTREGRFCDTVAEWALREIGKRSEFSVDVIDPATLGLAERHHRKDTVELVALKQRIANADCFIVVTPEYNHSYPAAIKFVIDSVHEPWHAKPVAFISYGGSSGGLRAVEHLRLVFAELHAVSIRDTVSFPNAWAQFNETGELRQADAAERSMTTMLERLKWWAIALSSAREAVPYTKAAA